MSLDTKLVRMVTTTAADHTGLLMARWPFDPRRCPMGSRAWTHLIFSIVVDVAEDEGHQTGAEVVG
jgi:hypothetical protein